MREWWLAGLPSGLSLRAFGAGSPLLLFFAGLPARTPEASLAAWLFFTISGYLVVIILAQMIDVLIQHRSVRLIRWVVSTVLVLSGPVMITASSLVALAAGTREFSWDWIPSLLGALALTTLIVVGARLDNLLTMDAGDRQRLLAELAREKALALESARLVETDRQRLLKEVRSIVGRRLGGVAETTSSPDSTAEGLRELVDESIRPLSHTLSKAQVREDELVDRIATMRVPSPRPLRSYISGVLEVGSGDRWLVRVAVVTGLAATLGGLWWGESLILSMIPLACAVFVGAVLLLTDARAIATERELSAALRAADRESSLVRQSAWVTRRHLANTMHGEVQGRILASALRVSGLPSGSIDREMSELSADLDRMLEADAPGGEWQVAWERLVAMWELAIDLQVGWREQSREHLASDGVAGAALVAVVGEAITNAVRHGTAGRVSIDVSVERSASSGGQSLLVEVVDDGASGSEGEPSMGSATLDAVCSTWELLTLPDGHVFRAAIPLREADEKSEYSTVAP